MSDASYTRARHASTSASSSLLTATQFSPVQAAPGRLNPGSWSQAKARLAYARSSSRGAKAAACARISGLSNFFLCTIDLLQLREVMCQMTCQQMHNPFDGKGAVVRMHEAGWTAPHAIARQRNSDSSCSAPSALRPSPGHSEMSPARPTLRDRMAAPCTQETSAPCEHGCRVQSRSAPGESGSDARSTSPEHTTARTVRGSSCESTHECDLWADHSAWYPSVAPRAAARGDHVHADKDVVLPAFIARSQR
jgi:hypothetical protein